MEVATRIELLRYHIDPMWSVAQKWNKKQRCC